MQAKVKIGQVSPVQQYNIGNFVYSYRDIVRSDGVVRVEYYRDDDDQNPQAFRRFRERLAYLHNEYDYWKTVVCDSVTFMELAARKYDEMVVNPLPPGKTKATVRKGDGVDPRQWFGASTDELENILCIRFAGLPMNVVVVAHINMEKNEVSGEILRMPFAPGRLSKRKLFNAAYQEQYYCYTARNEEREQTHLLKTQNDGVWAATSQIMAPDPCWPSYESIWQNWPAERTEIASLVYGDFGTGKSQFASTWPKPMLVFMFDGKGKDIPYWKELVW